MLPIAHDLDGGQRQRSRRVERLGTVDRDQGDQFALTGLHLAESVVDGTGTLEHEVARKEAHREQ